MTVKLKISYFRSPVTIIMLVLKYLWLGHYYLVCVFSSTSGTHIGGEARSRCLRPIEGEEELRKEVKDSVSRSPREERLDTDSRS